ncbi:MAG: hypothetical protein ACO1OQ_01080 [Rufibacter sp.]
MKKVVFSIILSLLIAGSIEEAFCQDMRGTPSYYLSYEENEKWLSVLKSAEKGKQVNLIIDRLIINNSEPDSAKDNCCYPALIIDGILLTNANQLSDSIAVELSSLLKQDNIKEVDILDKAAETIFCNPTFSGIILLSLKNRRINKQFKRLITYN